jgi:hypothetical protein
MKKAELNSKLRDYVKSQVSPTQAEQELVTKLYAAIRDALGTNCYLIGSYARFTASRPMHDIDVLFVAGDFMANELDPGRILFWLQQKLDQDFKNPTAYRVEISKQTHSITISFMDGKVERYAVDVVPALRSGAKNEFGDDVYWVPEILTVSKRNRQAQYEKLEKRNKREIEWWIKSDPRGYISEASLLNASCPDFRKATKLVKKWKHNCKKVNGEFELKSFHVEQAISRFVKQNPRAEISAILFEFFCDLPRSISHPQIPDRADRSKFIDDYVRGLTEAQKRVILEARDFFLIELENLTELSTVSSLVQGGLHSRASQKESYLFDQRIPVLTDPEVRLRVTGRLLPKAGFRSMDLDADGHIEIERKIDFSAVVNAPYNIDLLKWKVKNDNASPEPRGEISDHTTRNNPERTLYRGAHYVECYAIKQGRCVARARQNVVLKSV